MYHSRRSSGNAFPLLVGLLLVCVGSYVGNFLGARDFVDQPWGQGPAPAGVVSTPAAGVFGGEGDGVGADAFVPELTLTPLPTPMPIDELLALNLRDNNNRVYSAAVTVTVSAGEVSFPPPKGFQFDFSTDWTEATVIFASDLAQVNVPEPIGQVTYLHDDGELSWMIAGKYCGELSQFARLRLQWIVESELEAVSWNGGVLVTFVESGQDSNCPLVTPFGNLTITPIEMVEW